MRNYWEQLRCVARSPLTVKYDKSNFKIVESVFCPNTMCSSILCVQKQRLFRLSAEATINELNVCPSVRCAMFRLKNKQVRICWSVVKKSIFLKRLKKSFKIFLEMSTVLIDAVYDKSVSMSIHGKQIDESYDTNVCIAKIATTF